MTKEITNRAVTVARISGGPGQDRELSHGGQDTVMFAYCKEEGLDVIKPFYEVASGLDASKRPTLLEVMEFVLDPANRIFHVVFHDLSRFSRSKSDPHTYLKLLQEHDIIIHSAQNKTNSDDDNELLWDIHIIFNHEYSKTISQLTIRGQSDSVRMGNDISPVVTYGYEKYYVEEGGRPRPRWRPHPEHSEVVLTIFTMRDQKFLPMGICNHLNGLGIPAPKGGLWTTGTIINFLRSITYLGYSQVGKNPTSAFPKHRKMRELVQNPNAHPAIVPKELFDRVQKLMPKKPRAQREPPRSHDSPNPISNRVKCGNRNHKLANMIVGPSNNDGKKLMCSVKKNSGVRYCDTPDVKLDDFLNTLGGALKERLSVPAIIKEQLETLVKNSGKAIKQEKDRQAAITKRSKEIDQEKANLMKGIRAAKADYPENVSDFNKALSDLNKEKRQLEQQREDIDAESSELMAFLADPEGLMEALSELGNQIDPEDLPVTSDFLKSFIMRVDIRGDEASMYYSMPLTNTVETPDGFRTSVPIKREGSEILLEHCAPALAGIDPSPPAHARVAPRFPRTRGDRPRSSDYTATTDAVPPHSRG